MLCFLYSGTLPVFEFLESNINEIDLRELLPTVLRYRNANRDEYRARVIELLPSHLVVAYKYILNMAYDAKPDYQLIRLWLASSKGDE